MKKRAKQSKQYGKPRLVLRLNSEVIKDLKKKAIDEGMTISSFVSSKLSDVIEYPTMDQVSGKN